MLCSIITIGCWLAQGAVGGPPIIQAEAVAYHATGACAMGKEPGRGITRADGYGWVVSPWPGRHRIYAVGGTVTLPDGGDSWDSRPGQPQAIQLQPGATLYACPTARIAGRDECGPWPIALQYDAQRVAGR